VGGLRVIATRVALGGEFVIVRRLAVMLCGFRMVVDRWVRSH